MDLNHEASVKENVPDGSGIVLKDERSWERPSATFPPTKRHRSVAVVPKVIRTLYSSKDTIKSVSHPLLGDRSLNTPHAITT
jgi:hypothetical protein